MTKKKVPSPAKAVRTRHSPEFKQQALLRAMKDGVPVAARDLGLEPAQLYGKRPPTAPSLIAPYPLHYAAHKPGAKRWASKAWDRGCPRGGW
jgi:hypothetical protein